MFCGVETRMPDEVLGSGVHRGFPWIVIHNGLGYRCGYVWIPPGHPWHGCHYNDIAVRVHGGLTFAQGDDEDGWMVGFDCGHSGDLPDMTLGGDVNPIMTHIATILTTMTEGSEGPEGHLWTQDEVEAECRLLCEQADNVTRI